MEQLIAFQQEEAVALQLRSLFEQRGFRRVVVNKFEDYSLYIDNKNFLQSDQIITFMDMDGKLLALKPDVTLSIVKNIPRKTLESFEKLYYMDEVYRLSKENREYKVLSQIGVELIGPMDSFSGVEIIDLAIQSLQTISGRFVLDISHLGFVSGLLEQEELSHSTYRRVLGCIHSKSPHGIREILQQAGAGEDTVRRLMALCTLHGPVASLLSRAEELICNEKTREAYEELVAVGDTLSGAGLASHVNLDFSVVNDVDYYNGLIFLGYVEGVPNVVLTGGRYDNLMTKMGKQNGAIGFAVYLSELAGSRRPAKEYDFDVLITYAPSCSHGALLREIHRLNRQGCSVRVERGDCHLAALGYTYGRHCHLEGDQLQEENKQ